MIAERPVMELYEIATGKSPEALKDAVVALQKQGYDIAGGLVAKDGNYAQAMVQR